jgi:hypothetical protein
MNSRERILSALWGKEVDYVPLVINFWDTPLHSKLSWKNERQRLETYLQEGWDTYLQITPTVSADVSVKTKLHYATRNGVQVLQQSWSTPAGEITEQLKVTDDWDEAHDRTTNIGFRDDFRTPRYVEFPFKEAKDLETLSYLFPSTNPADEDEIIEEHKAKRALSREFNVPLFAYIDAGMDWLIWLFPPEEAIVRVVEAPEAMLQLLTRINDAKRKRLELLIGLGVDGVIRRGWYESTDFWSPGIFRQFAQPFIENEIRITHAAQVPYVYLMVTGIKALLPDLSAMPFDCLFGAEPALGDVDLKGLRSALPGKSIWGGLSGPMHLGRGTESDVERSVEQALSVFGKAGFILGMGVGFRDSWPWKNMEALVRAWKRLR